MGSYNTFEELYKFAMRTKNTMSGVVENLQSLKAEAYVNEFKLAIEKAKEVKKLPE